MARSGPRWRQVAWMGDDEIPSWTFFDSSCHRGMAPISGGGEDQGNIDVALVI
jgi:hypothetical protein